MSTKAMQTRNQKKKQNINDDEDDEQSPLALLFTEQFRDIFETHIVPKLRPKSELKFLKMAFKNARDAIERSKIKVGKKLNISEFTSISQMELAWDNYHWDEDEDEGTQEFFFYKVAQMNKLEYLVWAREVKNCDWDWRTIYWAAEQGNLAMVKFCVDNGCPMDEFACWCAAQYGHLDVLKYLHENDCPWDSDACRFAAQNGHLDVLKYLHEHDCPLSSGACYAAHFNNQIECLNYLIEQKCPGFEEFLPPPPAAAAQ
jgi:hypothetical protein